MAGYAKQHIANTLQIMLNDTPLDKIKVGDLIERSGVNRKTFYYHFHGMEDVLIYIIKTDMDNMPLTDANPNDWDVKIGHFIGYLQEKRLLIRGIYLSSYSELIRENLKNGLHDNIVPFVNNCLAVFEARIGRSLNAKPDELNTMADFLTCGIWPIIDVWVKRNYPYSPEKIVDLIAKLTNHNISKMQILHWF